MASLTRVLDRMLVVLEEEVLPVTQAAVTAGNKVFGAAVLRKGSLELVVVGTNEETKNPLSHGEISCLNRFWSLPRQGRPEPSECLFLSTHEPCSMCLSAIAWSGFDNFYYLFSYEDTRDAFEIPHDLNILSEIFHCADGAYADENAYWTAYDIPGLVAQAPANARAKLQAQIADLRAQYDILSERYQRIKGSGDIQLA